MSGKAQGIWIGTSGWVYKEWAGNFYPKGWPKKDEFSFYVRHFPTVEINATFYRLPSLKMVRGWHQRSPEGFRFAVKGSRFLTHIRATSMPWSFVTRVGAMSNPMRCYAPMAQ